MLTRPTSMPTRVRFKMLTTLQMAPMQRQQWIGTGVSGTWRLTTISSFLEIWRKQTRALMYAPCRCHLLLRLKSVRVTQTRSLMVPILVWSQDFCACTRPVTETFSQKVLIWNLISVKQKTCLSHTLSGRSTGTVQCAGPGTKIRR